VSEIIPIFDDFGQAGASAARGAQAARVMLMLGDFAFSIDTTAYNQLTREASWRWSEQERIGKQDLLQYTGKPGRTVRLEGESHAFFRKGVSVAVPPSKTNCQPSFMFVDVAQPP
jgi:hypothetical protein